MEDKDKDKEESPHSVQVPAKAVGMVIGAAGSVLKKLITATGCKIEVPGGGRGNNTDENEFVTIQLIGGDVQRRVAAAAITDIASGGDPDDHSGKAQGAMVIKHGLEGFARPSWAAWRLVPTEKEHGVKAEMGKHAVRFWAKGKRALTGEDAAALRASAEAAIALARELVEITVEARLEYDAENAVPFDAAVYPLVCQHGVLVRVQRPEAGVVPIEIVGPAEPARDAAALLEARFVKGKSTASVLQVAGQVQSMDSGMAGDFERDLAALETDSKVKITKSSVLLWVVGANEDAVTEARQILREMLAFYFPDEFLLVKDVKPGAIERLREDEGLRVLTAKPDCAVALDQFEGTVWICGNSSREAVKARIDAVVAQWGEENWEHDLPDFGAAMWLLGPRGSGDYLHRMQSESGAKLKVDPNYLKVYAEGTPPCIAEAKRLVLEAIQKLEDKKRQEEENGGPELKVKPLLSDAPPRMKAVLEKLAELNEKKRMQQQAERIKEWEALRAPPPQQPAAEEPAAEEPAAARERSRSPRRDPATT